MMIYKNPDSILEKFDIEEMCALKVIITDLMTHLELKRDVSFSKNSNEIDIEKIQKLWMM